LARQVAGRDFAGELAGELERGAGFWRERARVALESVAVERKVMLARVAAKFDERLDPGRELVARPQPPY
jgi:hypothetical protein